jgi:hypothetical protein
MEVTASPGVVDTARHRAIVVCPPILLAARTVVEPAPFGLTDAHLSLSNLHQRLRYAHAILIRQSQHDGR